MCSCITTPFTTALKRGAAISLLGRTGYLSEKNEKTTLFLDQFVYSTREYFASSVFNELSRRWTLKIFHVLHLFTSSMFDFVVISVARLCFVRLTRCFKWSICTAVKSLAITQRQYSLEVGKTNSNRLMSRSRLKMHV